MEKQSHKILSKKAAQSKGWPLSAAYVVYCRFLCRFFRAGGLACKSRAEGDGEGKGLGNDLDGKSVGQLYFAVKGNAHGHFKA